MEQNNLILRSFKNFALKNKLVQEDEIELMIDNVLGSYIVNTIIQFYSEYDNHKAWFDDNAEEQFDIENFSEIVEAFMTGFSQIKRNEICKWLVDLKQQIDNIKSETSDKNLKSIEPADDVVTKNHKKTFDIDPEIKSLAEMFPNLNLKEIKKAFKESHNDKTKTIEHLLIIENKNTTGVIYKDNDLTEEEKKQLKEKTLQK